MYYCNHSSTSNLWETMKKREREREILATNSLIVLSLPSCISTRLWNPIMLLDSDPAALFESIYL